MDKPSAAPPKSFERVRRNLLKKFPLAASLLGLTEPTATKKVRLGLAGDGPMLDAMVEAYRGLHRVESTTLYNPAEEKAEKDAKKHGVSDATSDLNRFMDAIDAVEVFDIPRRTELVEALLHAGKWVSVQKPFAFSVEEAGRMLTAEEQGRGRLRLNDPALFYEPYIKLKQLIDEMEIGEICAARFHANLVGKGGWGPMTEYFKGGRALFHPAFDKFALAIHLLGDIESVHSYINPFTARRGGQAVIGFKTKAEGCYGVFDLTYAPGTAVRTDAIPCDDTLEVAGTDGIIWVRHFHGRMTEEPSIEVRRGKKCYSIGIGSGMKTDWRDSLAASAAHFLRAAENRTAPRLAAKEAQKALAALTAALKAAGVKHEVRIKVTF